MRNERTPETSLVLHLIGSVGALYFYYRIIQAFLAGGPDAPSPVFLAITGVLLIGGAIAIAVMSLRLYKQEKLAQKAAQEEAQETED